MYQFTDRIDKFALFCFKSDWIRNKNWAMLIPSSKAILPVIASHTNKSGIAYPSEQTIGILAGLSDKQVREGVKGLEGFPGFSWMKYTTRRGRQAKEFKMDLPREPARGEGFPFYRYILESGCWRESKPTAKALYPVMRHYGYYIEDECSDNDDNPFGDADFREAYAMRSYDLCEAELPLMAEYAGITRPSVYNALDDLERCCLIEFIERGRWKVFLRSNGQIFQRSYLNEKVKKAYAHLD